jgi:cytochrome c5
MRAIIGLAVAASVLMAADAAVAATGQQIYDQHCGMCHNAMPPKLGDKAAWAPRIKKGVDVLVADSIKGINGMPPRGGTNLSDADMRAAVEYIVSKAR